MYSPALSIGDFARAAHMSVKMLRHYHQIGLLEPADVDPDTGYRSYTVEQLPLAQVIRRFRALSMPLEQIQAVLTAPDLTARNQLIREHLDALQAELAQTQAAVASLRDLLDAPSASPEGKIVFRHQAMMPAVAVSETINLEDVTAWFQGAIGEIAATIAAQDVRSAGPPGGIYSDELLSHERGEAIVFIPCAEEVRATGRIVSTVIPAAELATLTHAGAHSEIDRAYGALGAYVAAHALVVDGPIRESYITGRHDTDVDSEWRTEIGWPVFRTISA